jgi:serine/threonine protein kinase
MNMDLLVNQRYRLVRTLGKGGMGSVHLARDATMGDREVALKILQPEALDPVSVNRFKDEFRSLARLRHPNLVEVYDFGVVEERSCSACADSTTSTREGSCTTTSSPRTSSFASRCR